MAAFLDAKTNDRLTALGTPAAVGWSEDARLDAVTRLRTTGLPDRRDEYWKYTRPDAFTAPAATAAAAAEFEGFAGVDALTITFVDGVFDADASDDFALEGIEIERLATSDVDIHWAKDLYGVLETNGQTPVSRPLAALNTAYATDGLIIRVTGEVSKPISVVYLQKSDASDAILHHVVKVDAGASATILEAGPVAARANTVMEIDIADNATFNHLRLQGRDHEQATLTHTFTRLGNESAFKSFTLTANGTLTRNEAIIEMNGDDASAHVAGAALGDGGDFNHDDTVFVTHDALNGESRQVFKKVLRNGATGIFQGKILVKEGAQKTDGYQISQSLLLDDDAQFYAKPELEIYADDVACSHGSTTGAIDDHALYYLRSRGVPKAQAEDMLVLSFLAEAVDEIADEDLQDFILGKLETWLADR